MSKFHKAVKDVSDIFGGEYSIPSRKQRFKDNLFLAKQKISSVNSNLKHSFDNYDLPKYSFATYSLLPLLKISLCLILLVVFMSGLNMSDSTLMIRPFENVRINGTSFNPNVSYVDYDWLFIKGSQLGDFKPLIDYDRLDYWYKLFTFNNNFLDSTIGNLYRLLLGTFEFLFGFISSLFYNAIQFFKLILIW